MVFFFSFFPSQTQIYQPPSPFKILPTPTTTIGCCAHGNGFFAGTEEAVRINVARDTALLDGVFLINANSCVCCCCGGMFVHTVCLSVAPRVLLSVLLLLFTNSLPYSSPPEILETKHCSGVISTICRNSGCNVVLCFLYSFRARFN